ncbi:hypothetical protein [Novispirillum itersonii]|uniref:Uncharacterized protein n=1 Tax=Novispirillum itersonii TaxID=189 RepID=A0A7W9ZGZ6_NOVIT|nr:hypothetical protein [Novispirillum itersonii]MBB6210447.1 hypothetical protein [Novispirillum itersonii]
MDTPSTAAPRRIDLALARLGDAVDLLEQVGQAALDRMEMSGHDSGSLAALTAELSAVRSDYHSLKLTGQQASGRIDAAIGRLRAVLEM